MGWTIAHLLLGHVDRRAIDDPGDALEVRCRRQRTLVRVVVLAQLLQADPGQAVFEYKGVMLPDRFTSDSLTEFYIM